MENKEKEYVGIIIITLLHGIYTYIDLGRMPHISFGIFDRISVGAFVLWMIYSIFLYMIVQGWMIQTDEILKQSIFAILFGITSATVKGCIDLGVTKLSDYLQSIIKLAYIDQITTVLFGMLLMTVLIVFIAKRKIHFDIKTIKVPMCILIITVLSYVAVVINYIHQNQAAIRAYHATEEQIYNLDYHFGVKILDKNVWFYIIFYIAFWWFMRRLTEKSRFGCSANLISYDAADNTEKVLYVQPGPDTQVTITRVNNELGTKITMEDVITSPSEVWKVIDQLLEANPENRERFNRAISAK